MKAAGARACTSSNRGIDTTAAEGRAIFGMLSVLIGLDGALSKLSHNSYGPFLLGGVAAGLIGFALYSIADARYAKI
jgi:hypothetical protein